MSNVLLDTNILGNYTYSTSGIPIKEALLVVEKFRTEFTVLYPTEKSNTIFIDLLKK